MYAPRPQSNDSFVMKEQLADGTFSCFERSVPLEVCAVEARDTTILIPGPEQFLGTIECHNGYRSNYGVCAWGRQRQACDLRGRKTLTLFIKDTKAGPLGALG